MAVLNPILTLYARFEAAGLSRHFIKGTALPSWWDDGLAREQPAYAQALGLISQHLGIDLRLLWDEHAPISCATVAQTKFKRRKNVTEADLRWSECVALSAARLAVAAMDRPYREMPAPAQIREQILKSGQSCVNLDNLLDYLWNAGVPVLHVAEFPPGAKKMEGLAAVIDGRPVIVISKNHKFPALLVFIVAHELGHVIRGHVADGRVIVDEKVNDEEVNAADAEEREANASAVELLTGDAERLYGHGNRLTAGVLARRAVQTGQRDQVDPGVVAMSYAHGRSFYQVGISALGKIEAGRDAVQTVRQKMIKELRLDRLPDDSVEFLLRVAAGGADAVLVGQ